MERTGLARDMPWRRASKVAAIAVVVACTFGVRAQQGVTGKPAPNFSRVALDGKTVRLGDYRGRVVLLNFWATWCAPCQAELPHFAKWQRKYGAQGLQVIAVSMDDAPAAPYALVRKIRPGYPVVMGDDALGTLYGGILGLPVTFLIARDGSVVERVEGETDLITLEMRVAKLLAR